MGQTEFVHLHVHSEYSLLDGLPRIGDLTRRAAELGQPAVALTDHGAMYGVIPFYEAAKATGIKPLIGMEAYLANGQMKEKDPKRFHQLLLAQNQQGILNLFALASAAQLEGFYYKPRIDWEILSDHSAGLISTTGCLAGPIPQALLADDIEKARQLMERYIDIFGRDRFFIEFQEHEGVNELKPVNEKLLQLMHEFNLRAIATNDVHYVHKADHVTHDLLLCVQTGKRLSDQDRMRLTGHYHMATGAEMEAMFGHIPGALSNTLLIAEMCNVNLDADGYRLPKFDVPEGYTPASYLRELCEQGAQQKYDDRFINDPAVRERLDYELSIISEMGFDTYFLIVWDLCRYAKEVGIWWNVRGSGAGSVVAYTLNITDIEPLSNGLMFERFLNPHRISMPDIDLDYPDDDRSRMVHYLRQKYGNEKVASIITFGRLGAKLAVRDTGRALDIPLSNVDAISRLIPDGKTRIERVLDPQAEGHFSPELAALYEEDTTVQRLLDEATKIEGMVRNPSTHAAGVIVADRPLHELLPLNRPLSNEGLGGIDRITQWPMGVLEAQGLLKIDFLGLATLTVMREAARLIEKRHGVRYTMENVPYDIDHVGPDPDRETQALFNLLGRGETAGVFQVESDGMRKVLMQMKPSRFQHIVAVLALYRPGPMQYIPDYIARMHGKQEVEYRHPALVEILGDTYGIIVYQEQIMQIASELAGYTPGEADMIRKAVGKKQHTEIAYHRNKFISGCVENGIDEKTASAIYTDIEKFANYGFNRAHATDYAKVTCQTAFLKAHYPVEYMAALLSVERNKTDKVARNLAEVRRMGFRIKPPDINESEKEFSIGSPEDGAPVIRFGLGAIKNVGDGPVDEILVEREVNGPFADLVDFAARINLKSMGKRPLEAFTYAGVFDCWGSRDQIFAVLDQAITYSHNKHKAASTGQMSLFGERMDMDDDILIPDAQDVQPDPLQLLAKEKEMLGFYVSEHPLEKWIEVTRNKISATSGILRYLDKQRVLLLGLVTGVHHYTTRNGQPMAFVQMEDLESSFNLVIFSGEWEKYRKYVAINRILFVSGDVQVEDEKISIIVKGLHPVERHSEVREQTMYHIPDYIIRETETDDVDNESYDEAESATDEKNDIVSQPASHINNETQANGATAGVATIQSAELNISNNGDQVFHNPTLPSSSIARWQMEYESPVYEELDTPPTCIQFTIAPTTHWQAVIRKIVTVLPEQVPGTCSVVICIAGSNLEAYFKHATVEWSPDLFERVRLLPNIIEVVPYIELEERETPPVMQRQAMVVA